jgi:nucleotide-binding universal stress UspA family protein
MAPSIGRHEPRCNGVVPSTSESGECWAWPAAYAPAYTLTFGRDVLVDARIRWQHRPTVARTRTRRARPVVRARRRRILVATDFSPDSKRAVETAAGLARALGTEVVVVHVDEPLLELTHSNEHVHRRRRANAALDRLARTLVASGIPARASLRVGKPAPEIVAAATEQDAELLVIGTRGLSMTAAALLGGVAYDVIRKATCPVLTVRASRGDRRKPEAWQPG